MSTPHYSESCSVFISSVWNVSSCRIKRIEQIDELESEKSQEYLDMEAMEEENVKMRLQLQDLQARYAALKKFAILRNIPIPLELEWTSHSFFH